VVNVWEGWTGLPAKSFHKLVDQYNSGHAGVHIVALDGADYQKLLTSISGGTPPDVAELFTDYLGTFANNGVIQPVDAWAQALKFNLKGFSTPALSPAYYNGKLYGIPFMNDCLALYWNKTVFKAAGLDPNRPPRTLSELLAMARTLDKVGPGGKIERMGFDPTGLFHELTWDFGGDFAAANNTKITANTPAAIKALTWEQSIYQRLGPKNIAAFESGQGNYASAANPFFRGQLGMTFDGEWLRFFIGHNAPNLQYGVVSFPYPDGMPQMAGTTAMGGGLWVVPKGAKNATAAMAFIQWLTTRQDNQVFYADALTNLPTLKAIRDSSTYKAALPHNDFFLGLAIGPHAHFFPATAVTTQYETDLGKAEQDVLFGKNTPAKALAAVQSKDQAALNSALGKGGGNVP